MERTAGVTEISLNYFASDAALTILCVSACGPPENFMWPARPDEQEAA